MNEMKSKNYTHNIKLLCDWTDRKNYLSQYRVLKSGIRYGVIVDKTQDLIPFEESK